MDKFSLQKQDFSGNEIAKFHIFSMQASRLV